MTTASGFDRPATLLDGVGVGAFEAFNAMQTTKQRHYRLLSRLDEQRSRYAIAPTQRETLLLAALLADHDAQVARFSAASRLLKEQDPDAHRRLFDYIGAMDDSEARH